MFVVNLLPSEFFPLLAIVGFFPISLFAETWWSCWSAKRFFLENPEKQMVLLIFLQTFVIQRKWHPEQGRNEVRWHPGQKTSLASPWSNRRPHGRSLAPPWSNLSSFESKFTVLKKVLVTLLGLPRLTANDDVTWAPMVELARDPACLKSGPAWRQLS